MVSYVYAIVNKVNGKMYIGKTNMPKRRWNSHKRAARRKTEQNKKKFYVIHRAIAKHKPENFIFTIIDTLPTETEALAMEKYWIAFYDTFKGIGYNMTEGGEGASPSQATRDKIRASTSGEK